MKSLGANLTPSAIYGTPIAGESAQLTADAVVQAFLKRASAPPTVEQYRLDVHFALESVPTAVRDLSFTSHGFQLNEDEREWLALIAGECSPASGLTEDEANAQFALIAQHPMFAQIEAKCQVEIDKFDTPPFFKFGTRAPKDSPYFVQFNGRVPTGGAVICNIATSWRAFEDLAISQTHSGASKGFLGGIASLFASNGKRANPDALDHLPWLWFREFKAWQPWQEFRCFMRDRQFVGATQYYGIVKTLDGRYEDIVAYPDLIERGHAYEAAIKAFFHDKFLPATEGFCKGCVFDVVVDLDSNEAFLIEMNPATFGTFPGFMDWNDPKSFDGELKWADASYLPDSGVIRIDAREIERYRSGSAADG